MKSLRCKLVWFLFFLELPFFGVSSGADSKTQFGCPISPVVGTTSCSFGKILLFKYVSKGELCTVNTDGDVTGTKLSEKGFFFLDTKNEKARLIVFRKDKGSLGKYVISKPVDIRELLLPSEKGKSVYSALFGVSSGKNCYIYMLALGQTLRSVTASSFMPKSLKGVLLYKLHYPDTNYRYGREDFLIKFDPKNTDLLKNEKEVVNLDSAVSEIVKKYTDKGFTDARPSAENDTVYVPVDFSTQILISPLSNDSDSNKFSFSLLRILNYPSWGHITIKSDSTLIYSVTSWDDFKSDSFSYEIINEMGAVSAATVFITYAPPDINSSSVYTEKNKPLTFDVGDIAYDPYGGEVSLDSISIQPSHGETVVTGNTVTYTPEKDYTGTDTFSCVISNTYSQNVTVEVTVYTDEVTAKDDKIVTKINTSVTINPVDNDTDACNLSLSVTDYTSPSHGSLQLLDNSFLYTPDTDFNDIDSFSYTVSNGHGVSANATVYISVGDGPHAADDTAYTAEGSTVSIHILANDIDPLNLSLSILSVDTPSHGSVTQYDDYIDYTPEVGYTGTDSFNYTVKNSAGQTSTATVTVYVDKITVRDDTIGVRWNTSKTFDVLSNDIDACNLPLSVYAHGSPTHGTLVHNDDDTFTYTPEKDFIGKDSFDYVASNSHGINEKGTVVIYVSETPTPDSWSPSGEAADDNYGYTVASADVNGDGYDDVLVAASHWGGTGYVRLYYGTDTGLSSSSGWTYREMQTGAFPGFTASAGDVNGDGYDDVIIGMPLYDGESGEDEGKVIVFYGSASGLNATPDWSYTSGSANARFGRAVACAGDVNGDGYDDVIIGAPWYNNYAGKVFLFYGSASGLSSSPGWTKEGETSKQQFGFAVTGGKITSDKYTDVIITAKGYSNGEDSEGAAFMFTGSETGLSDSAIWSVESNISGAEFGYSVALADINADGNKDILVGAWLYGHTLASQGAVYVFLSKASGPNTSPLKIIEGNGEGSLTGICVSSAGDLNKDGYEDIIFSAPAYDGFKGKVYLYHGTSEGLEDSPHRVIIGDAYGDLGYGLTSGDFNNDGYDDIVITAPYYNSKTGQAYAYYGKFDSL